MSLECVVCERDIRGEHDADCPFFKGEIVSNGAPDRTKMTWRCDRCGAEWDHLTYGGPCPGRDLEGCHGELRRRKVEVGPDALKTATARVSEGVASDPSSRQPTPNRHAEP